MIFCSKWEDRYFWKSRKACPVLGSLEPDIKCIPKQQLNIEPPPTVGETEADFPDGDGHSGSHRIYPSQEMEPLDLRWFDHGMDESVGVDILGICIIMMAGQ